MNYDALAVRVLGYLGLALLPIGVIALAQAQASRSIEREQAELALVALTEQAIRPFAVEIGQAIAATEALALSRDLLLSPDDCDDAVSRFTATDAPFDYVLFNVEGGASDVCVGGVAPGYLPTTWPVAANGGTRIEALPSPDLPQAISVTHPVVDPALADGRVLGELHTLVQLDPQQLPEVRDSRRGVPSLLVTFTTDGTPLTLHATGPAAAAPLDYLPDEASLPELARDASGFFVADSTGGSTLGYTVVPVSEGLVYALAAWHPGQSGRPVGLTAQAPLALPALMWTISLGVAAWALGRLVVKPVRELARRMNMFGTDRTLVSDPLSGDLTRELREIDGVFRTMASSVVRDEARMRVAIEERSALLREVHHRVKNNLQLISSIVSMQLRRSDDPEVRAMLRRLQDRVLTLAAIYRSLYTSADMTDVNVAPILRQIVEREVESHAANMSPRVEIDDLRLDADKVVPLVFLAAEAVSNATAASAPGQGTLTVRLRRMADGRATLDVENDLNGEAPVERRRGLGAQLMAAFAAQIGAPVQSGERDGIYRVSITFDVDGGATVADGDLASAPIPAS